MIKTKNFTPNQKKLIKTIEKKFKGTKFSYLSIDNGNKEFNFDIPKSLDLDTFIDFTIDAKYKIYKRDSKNFKVMVLANSLL